MPTGDDTLSRPSFFRQEIQNSIHDLEILPTIDRIPVSRASVAVLDKLWTQIDVLDDVKAMADTVSKKGSFFAGDFSSSVEKIKVAQGKLVEKMKSHQTASKNAHREEERLYSNKPNSEVSMPGENDTENEELQKRMNDFFALPPKPVSHDPKLQDFDELGNYISEVRRSLRDVLDHMQEFDDVRRKLW